MLSKEHEVLPTQLKSQKYFPLTGFICGQAERHWKATLCEFQRGQNSSWMAKTSTIVMIMWRSPSQQKKVFWETRICSLLMVQKPVFSNLLPLPRCCPKSGCSLALVSPLNWVLLGHTARFMWYFATSVVFTFRGTPGAISSRSTDIIIDHSSVNCDFPMRMCDVRAAAVELPISKEYGFRVSFHYT